MEKMSYHPILDNQIKMFINPELMEIPEILDFLDEVNKSYRNFDESLKQLQKLLDISVSKLAKSKNFKKL